MGWIIAILTPCQVENKQEQLVLFSYLFLPKSVSYAGQSHEVGLIVGFMGGGNKNTIRSLTEIVMFGCNWMQLYK